MIRVGLLVRLIAKTGKEAELSDFLETGLSLAMEEPETIVCLP